MAARAASTSSEGRNGASVSMKAARRCTVACRTRNSPCGSSKRPLPTYSHGDYARGSGNRGCGRAPSAVSTLLGQGSPLGKEGASGLENTDRLLGQDERRRLIVHGASKISWPPTRRHRIAGSPSSSTSSKVARPSGPANDQVISQIPAASCTRLIRSLAGQWGSGRSPRAAYALLISRTARWKRAHSAGLRRA